MGTSNRGDSVFVHSVFFWLKEGTAETVLQEMEEDCWKLIDSMPMVQSTYVGYPAGTPREVVDNSYSLGLTTILPDPDAHDAYQVHPNHQQFLEKYKSHWEKVQIYDFIQ